MSAMLRVSGQESVDLASYETIAFGVFALDEGLEVPGGDHDGTVIPAILDPEFAQRHRFEAKAGQVLVVNQSQGGPVVLAIGCGDGKSEESWRQAGASLARSAAGERALFLLPSLEAPTIEALGESVTTGAILASYEFAIRSESPPAGLESMDLALISSTDGADEALASGIAAGIAVGEAVSLARDLVNAAPSAMTPSILAERAIDVLNRSGGVTSELWELDRIEEEHLGGLLGVALGSEQDPRLVYATYEPEGTASLHVVLVGKGVTFDSGGLSLKTAQGMTTMKTDMTGSAVVVAALSACHALGVTARVTVIAPMTENMPSGSATKPGDVLVARNGKTIEVLNTDAEGRLILADGLSLAVEADPDVIIDIATLTGAAVAALGTEVAAFFSTDDDLADKLYHEGERSGEAVWRMPLVSDYESHIKSEVADIKNIGAPGQAGAISAALFLKHFVGDTPWAHLDIAGPARSEKSGGYLAKGGTAFGLRLLLGYLRSL